jgi:hypothetical protein
MVKVTLKVETPEGDSARAVDLANLLRDQIKQLPIESIETPKTTPVPEGARSGDAFSWGVLTVSLAPVVVEQLLYLLRDRVKRQRIPAKVVVECEGKKVTIEGTPDVQQLEAVEKFIKEINAKPG